MNSDELHRYGILAAIQDLHMNLNGSSDILPPERITWMERNDFSQEEVYQALLNKLREWQVRSNKARCYDNIIKALLQEVIWEYEEVYK